MRRVAGVGIALVWIAAVTGGHAQTRKAPDPLRETALTLEQQGKNAEAEAAWRAFLKANPSDPEPYAHLGLLEARQEHYKEAIPLYRKALTLGPQIPSVLLNLGLAQFKGGELKESIATFEPLIKREPPASPMAQQLTLLIGMAHYGLAEYAAAAPYLQQAADSDPNSLPLLLALAHSYLWSKQSRQVLDVYKKILLINPDSAEADMLAGEALDEMKDNEGSTKMFRAAVKANPKEPNVHFGLGYLLWSQKQYPEAAREFQAELANDPNHAQAMLYLADSDVQMNQMAAAQPLLEKAVKLDPSLALAYLDLGIVYSEAGRNEDALRELAVAAKLTPDDVNVHWRLGRLYRTMGKKEEAKAEFDKASKLNKAADEDLYKKIANGAAHPPQAQTAPADK
ncbi:MAG: tetratricopeptide repeat protein [Acidobacteriota bacterium]|nr:tetratricopeptide repeat protein [Acidobacteriota bacterium]